MKTSELTGAALDWAVMRSQTENAESNLSVWFNGYNNYGLFHYSTNWAHGGPLIERKKLSVVYNERGDGPSGWRCLGLVHMLYGDTPLISAMRCLVASELGDEVEIPEELT